MFYCPFVLEESLFSAFTSKHGKTLHVTALHSAANPCDYCSRAFGTARSLLIHIQRRHFKKYVSDKEAKGEPIANIICYCTICQKPFLDGTMRSKHESTHIPKEKPSEKIRLNSIFNKHSIKINDRTWQCRICQKEFKQYYAMYLHRRVHSDEKPYACRYCHKK